MDKLKSLQSWVRDLKHANEVPIPTYLSHLTTALKLAADQAAEIKRLREALQRERQWWENVMELGADNEPLNYEMAYARLDSLDKALAESEANND